MGFSYTQFITSLRNHVPRIEKTKACYSAQQTVRVTICREKKKKKYMAVASPRSRQLTLHQ